MPQLRHQLITNEINHMPTPQSLPSDYDYSQCFGIKAFCEKLDPECYLCDYIHACYYAAFSPNPESSRSGLVSYDKCSHLSEAAVQPDQYNEPDQYETDDEPQYTRKDLAELLAFLLRVDEYTLQLAINALTGRTSTAAELAQAQGVSRQAIHQKLMRAVKCYPEIKELLLGNIYRCKRIVRGDITERTYHPPKRGTGAQTKKHKSLY